MNQVLRRSTPLYFSTDAFTGLLIDQGGAETYQLMDGPARVAFFAEVLWRAYQFVVDFEDEHMALGTYMRSSAQFTGRRLAETIPDSILRHAFSVMPTRVMNMIRFAARVELRYFADANVVCLEIF